MKGIWEFSVLFLELFYKSELGQNDKLKGKTKSQGQCVCVWGVCVFKGGQTPISQNSQCSWGDRY